MNSRVLISLLFWSVVYCSFAQEEFTHLQYNLTLYGNPFSCNETNNNSDEKDAALDLIIDHVQPDIFTVNEMRDSDVWADRILDNVLNDDNDLWSRAELTDQFGFSSLVNACYYRNDRFSLYDQEVVYQSLDGANLVRHIDLYTLYMDLPGLEFGDTTFVTLVVAHLSASDALERAEQTEALMAYIEGRGLENYIFSGDLNIDSSLETSYQNLINHSDPDFSFMDPVDAPGTWHNNASFSDYHTQSTRFGDTNNGCFSGGGLDDRFDFTMISQYVSEGVAGVQYIPNSYEVVGQSGNDYNQELQIIGNQVVPSEIAQALYDMSDHLPVKTEYAIDQNTALTSDHESLDFNVFIRDGRMELWTDEPKAYLFELFDVGGRLLYRESFQGRHHTTQLGGLQGQAIVLRLSSDNGMAGHKVQFIH